MPGETQQMHGMATNSVYEVPNDPVFSKLNVKYL